MTSSKRAALELQQLIADNTKYELELLEVLEVQATWRTRGDAVLCHINTPNPLNIFVFEASHHADTMLFYFDEVHLPTVLLCRDPVTLSNYDFISRSTSNTRGTVLVDFAEALAISSWHPVNNP
jgi:hypothetical protein